MSFSRPHALADANAHAKEIQQGKPSSRVLFYWHGICTPYPTTSINVLKASDFWEQSFTKLSINHLVYTGSQCRFTSALSQFPMHTVSQVNDTDIAHYNFNAYQPILVIFGRDVAKRICYQMVICYPTSHNWCLCTTWGNMNTNPGNCLFSHAVYHVSKTTLLWLAISLICIKQF